MAVRWKIFLARGERARREQQAKESKRLVQDIEIGLHSDQQGAGSVPLKISIDVDDPGYADCP